MTIFGKSLSDYISFVKGFCILLLIVGTVKLAMSLSGVPDSTTRLLSISAVLLIGVVYYGIRVHTSGFGSYKQLLPVIAIPNAVTHVISIVGIVIGIVTGESNVFTAPEAAFGGNGLNWLHAGAHVFVGMTVGCLFNWLIGCLFMFIAKKLFKRGDISVQARV